MPLVIAPLNKILCVIKILTDEKTKKHLFDLGITVNSKIEVLKNNKNIEVFNVKVEEDKTIIDEVEGFSIDTLDEPPEFFDYDLDIPPVVNSSEGKING